MRRVRSLVSILLIFVILLGMQFFISEDVSADSTFSNVQLNGDVLSWDPINNLYGYYRVAFVRADGQDVGGSGFSSNRIDLADSLDGKPMATPGMYTVTLTATDKLGNAYKWIGNYNYNKIELNSITNPVIDPASGYLTWSHDTSNASGAKITYRVDITIDGYEEFEIKTTDRKISVNSFARMGTHDYEINIVPSAPGFRSGFVSTDYLNGVTITNGSTVTGLNIKDNVLTWNKVSGADSYYIYAFYKTGPSTGHYVETTVDQPYYYIPYDLHKNGAMCPQTITYCVSALQGRREDNSRYGDRL